MCVNFTQLYSVVMVLVGGDGCGSAAGFGSSGDVGGVIRVVDGGGAAAGKGAINSVVLGSLRHETGADNHCLPPPPPGLHRSHPHAPNHAGLARAAVFPFVWWRQGQDGHYNSGTGPQNLIFGAGS